MSLMLRPAALLQKAKMKDMTEQLDCMSSELSKLRMENNALKNRNSILEKVGAAVHRRGGCGVSVGVRVG